MDIHSFKDQKKYFCFAKFHTVASFIGAMTLLESILFWGLGMIQIYEMFDPRTDKQEIRKII